MGASRPLVSRRSTSPGSSSSPAMASKASVAVTRPWTRLSSWTRAVADEGDLLLLPLETIDQVTDRQFRVDPHWRLRDVNEVRFSTLQLRQVAEHIGHVQDADHIPFVPEEGVPVVGMRPHSLQGLGEIVGGAECDDLGLGHHDAADRDLLNVNGS